MLNWNRNSSVVAYKKLQQVALRMTICLGEAIEPN
jgi:hypothetical protein